MLIRVQRSCFLLSSCVISSFSSLLWKHLPLIKNYKKLAMSGGSLLKILARKHDRFGNQRKDKEITWFSYVYSDQNTFPPRRKVFFYHRSNDCHQGQENTLRNNLLNALDEKGQQVGQWWFLKVKDSFWWKRKVFIIPGQTRFMKVRKTQRNNLLNDTGWKTTTSRRVIRF